MDNKNSGGNISITEKVPLWKLRLSYFYAENHLVLKRLGLFLLFFADLVIVFLLGSKLIDYQTGALKEQKVLNELSRDLVNRNVIIEKLAPQPLAIIEPASVINYGKQTYDIVARVKNENKEWAIKKLAYTFAVDGFLLETKTAFLLPNEEKPLFYFRSPKNGRAELKIIETEWVRVRDFGLISHLGDVTIKKAQFNISADKQLGGEIAVTIANNGPYNFWAIGIPIIIYSGGKPTGIYYSQVNDLKSRQEKEIKILWHEKISPTVDKVYAQAEINLLNDQVIKKIEGGAQSGLGQ